MTKFGWVVVLVLAVIIAGGAWALLMRAPSGSSEVANTTPPSATSTGTVATSSEMATTTPRTLVATAVYSCDKGKTITAAYYKGPKAPTPAPGQPPVPTGSVDVSFNGGATTTLAQTISADGTRYGNADESLVFWSKGNTALVMKNNSIDLTFKNCATK